MAVSEITQGAHATIDRLATEDPLGECYYLPQGNVLARPNLDVVARLQEIDDRVRYFPADLEAAASAARGVVCHRAVADVIGKKVLEDFPDEDLLLVRGTTAALTVSFESRFYDGRVNSVLGLLYTALVSSLTVSYGYASLREQALYSSITTNV